MLSTKKLFFLISFLILQSQVFSHPIYVSISQIDYNEGSKRFEISIKIFADDLINALKNSGAPEIYLGEDREIQQADSLINDYIESKFSIEVNSKKANFFFVGKEMETNAVWIYYESEEIDEPHHMKVKSDVLIELFDSQNNIIQFTNKGETKNFLLDKNETEVSIEI